MSCSLYECKIWCVCLLFHLELGRHSQFRSLQPHEHVQTHEGHDGHEDGKVADELPHLKKKSKNIDVTLDSFLIVDACYML